MHAICIVVSCRFTTVTLFASAESCCDESILLPAGQTEFDISNCYNCLICFGDVSDRIHAVWHDEQGHSGTASDNGDGETFKVNSNQTGNCVHTR